MFEVRSNPYLTTFEGLGPPAYAQPESGGEGRSGRTRCTRRLGSAHPVRGAASGVGSRGSRTPSSTVASARTDSSNTLRPTPERVSEPMDKGWAPAPARMEDAGHLFWPMLTFGPPSLRGSPVVSNLSAVSRNLCPNAHFHSLVTAQGRPDLIRSAQRWNAGGPPRKSLPAAGMEPSPSRPCGGSWFGCHGVLLLQDAFVGGWSRDPAMHASVARSSRPTRYRLGLSRISTGVPDPVECSALKPKIRAALAGAPHRPWWVHRPHEEVVSHDRVGSREALRETPQRAADSLMVEEEARREYVSAIERHCEDSIHWSGQSGKKRLAGFERITSLRPASPTRLPLSMPRPLTSSCLPASATAIERGVSHGSPRGRRTGPLHRDLGILRPPHSRVAVALRRPSDPHQHCFTSPVPGGSPVGRRGCSGA